MISPDHAGSDSAPYQPSANLRKFVKEGELEAIRAALRFELNDNRLSRQHLLDALDWTKERVPNVCDPYEEKAFARAIDRDLNHWTPEYYDTQVVYLTTNFSAERWQHLVDVRIYLRDRGTEGFVPTDDALGKVAHATEPDFAGGARAQNSQPSQPFQHGTSSRSQPQTRPASNPHRLLKIALIVGGALAAAFILLTLTR